MTRKYLRIDGIQIGAVPLTTSGNTFVTGGPIDLSNSAISWNSVTNKPTTVSTFTNDANYANVSYVDNSISSLVASAPETLNTLNELSLALNNDVNFATTITTLIGTKANTAGLSTVAFTGNYSDLLNKPIESGYTGSAGANGFTGSQGPSGYTGSAGTNGTNGTNGFTGSQGIAGFTGSAGTNGTNGFTGSQGATGPVAGSNTQIIFNDGGVAAGNANLTFDKTTSTLDVNGTLIAGSGTPLGGATNPIVAAISSTNNYVQNYIYNPNSGNSASADFIAYPNNGTDATGWIDVGITSNTFNQAAYSVTSANEGYVFMSAPSGAGKTGNLVIATDSTGNNNSIEFYVGGFGQTKSGTARKLLLSTTGGAINGDLSVSGNISGNTNGFTIGYLNIPQVSFSTSSTLALPDAGKHYYSTSSSNLTLTVPTNANVAFAIGATINVINQGTGTITISPSGSVTMYLAGNSTSSSRTLSSYGLATITKVATDTWFVAGVGLT